MPSNTHSTGVLSPNSSPETTAQSASTPVQSQSTPTASPTSHTPQTTDTPPPTSSSRTHAAPPASTTSPRASLPTTLTPTPSSTPQSSPSSTPQQIPQSQSSAANQPAQSTNVQQSFSVSGTPSSAALLEASTTAPLILPTTQSLSVSGTGDYTFASVYETTDSQGHVHTVTAIIARPSSQVATGFSHNKGAVAGVSVVVGIIGASIIALAFFLWARRRQSRRDEEANAEFGAFERMSYAWGTEKSRDGSGGSPRADAEAQRQSVLSLNQAPMQLNDFAGMSNLQLVSYDHHGDGRPSFDPYGGAEINQVNEVNEPAGTFAPGFGTAARRSVLHGTGNPQFIPLPPSTHGHDEARASEDVNPFALGDDDVETAPSDRKQGTVYHARNQSAKSYGLPSLHGLASSEDDDGFFASHGPPIPDGQSDVLGRPSRTFASQVGTYPYLEDSHEADSDYKGRRITASSQVSLRDDVDYSPRVL